MFSNLARFLPSRVLPLPFICFSIIEFFLSRHIKHNHEHRLNLAGQSFTEECFRKVSAPALLLPSPFTYKMKLIYQQQ
jgi:hypothetical protein